MRLTRATGVAVSKTPWQEIRVRSGRDDKLVALKLPIIQWMHARPCLNKFVISTGAQRSGEICGFFSVLTQPLRPLEYLLPVLPSSHNLVCRRSASHLKPLPFRERRRSPQGLKPNSLYILYGPTKVRP